MANESGCLKLGPLGAEDERGAANLLTPEVILRAAGLIKTGRTYDLALTLDRATLPVSPSRVPMVHLMSLDGGDFASRRSAATTDAPRTITW